MVLKRIGDVPAADWLSQINMKNYCYFTHMVIKCFSVVEIAAKHASSSDNNYFS